MDKIKLPVRVIAGKYYGGDVVNMNGRIEVGYWLDTFYVTDAADNRIAENRDEVIADQIADALNAAADKDRQIAVLENRTACLTGEVTALRKTLKECRIKWDTADNGMCAVCRTGFRLFDLKGNVQKCENTECLSHRIDEALSYGDSCDICGKEMKSKGQEERIKNAIFGAHSNCLDVESQRIQEGENA